MFQVENADIYVRWLVKVHSSLLQFKIMQASRGGKHPLSGSRDWFNFQRNCINNCFTVVETLYSKKKKEREISLHVIGSRWINKKQYHLRKSSGQK